MVKMLWGLCGKNCNGSLSSVVGLPPAMALPLVMLREIGITKLLEQILCGKSQPRVWAPADVPSYVQLCAESVCEGLGRG